MQTLRTPEERFADLPDYPFEANYVEVDDDDGGTLRVHHLDVGPADGPIVLAMHGEKRQLASSVLEGKGTPKQVTSAELLALLHFGE